MKLNMRLLDVFIDGPLQIYIGTLIRNPFLKFFMILTGITSILFNGYNYMCVEQGNCPFIHPLMNRKEGKHQYHRLWNLLLMYPIFLIVSLQPELPTFWRVLLIISTIVGFGYNLYNYISSIPEYGYL